MLRLRPFKDCDAKTIVQWIKDETTYYKWCLGRLNKYPLDPEDLISYYESYRNDATVFPMTAYDEDGIVGHILVQFADDTQQVIAFSNMILDYTRWGRGFGKEMLQLSLQYAFGVLRAQKATIDVLENNASAYRCYLSVGFGEDDSTKGVICDLPIGKWLKKQLWCTNFDYTNSEQQQQIQSWNDVWGVCNQDAFIEKLDTWKKQQLFAQQDLLFLCLDIDGLATINGVYGYSEGNQAINTFKEIIDDSLKETEVCTHMGGNEFVVAMPCVTEEANDMADAFVENIRNRLDTYNQVSGKDYGLAINVHHLVMPVTEESNLKSSLEDALRSKHMVQKEVWFQEEADSNKLKEAFPGESGVLIKNIIDNNLLRYAFQPIVDAKTGDIYGYEALMRADVQDNISPLTILKYATLSERLQEIEHLTITNVLGYLEQNKEAFGNRKVFINCIPGFQLNNEQYGAVVEKYGKLFEQVTLEVTEQTELEDDVLKILLERSDADGYRIAIDDYGTGYSNTSSLLRYLPNCVKIDRLLISNIQEEPKKQHFVKSIIEFCHDNGILVLAEGVETVYELKAVVKMGVDLIQGYYTAKPSFEVVTEIDKDKISDLVDANMKADKQVTRKIYMVDSERELPLMRLALEQYNGIFLSNQEVVLTGNAEYSANMTIKIKDDSNCKLTLKNVHLEAAEDFPCIDIGKGASLTLVLEGDSELIGLGIRVPEESTLTLEGTGNLSIKATGVQCYGIGTETEVGIGSIYCNMSGNLQISVDGNNCYGMGGGIYRKGDGIHVNSGGLSFVVAGVETVAVGCKEGDVPIDISNCRLDIDMNVFTGIGIGSVYGNQNVKVSNMSLNISGAGSKLCGVGSTETSGGRIFLKAGKVITRMTGQNVGLIGSQGNGLTVDVEDTGLDMVAEGSSILGLGCKDMSGFVNTTRSTLNLVIRAAESVAIGAERENIQKLGGIYQVKINED